MYLKYMSEKNKGVKTGDRVAVQGWRGTVTEVIRYNQDTPDKAGINVRVAFDTPEKIGYQYEGGQYGEFEII